MSRRPPAPKPVSALLYWPRLPFDETQVQWFASVLLDNGPHSFFEQAIHI
jgi:hypothetical protein